MKEKTKLNLFTIVLFCNIFFSFDKSIRCNALFCFTEITSQLYAKLFLVRFSFKPSFCRARQISIFVLMQKSETFIHCLFICLCFSLFWLSLSLQGLCICVSLSLCFHISPLSVSLCLPVSLSLCLTVLLSLFLPVYLSLSLLSFCLLVIFLCFPYLS